MSREEISKIRDAIFRLAERLDDPDPDMRRQAARNLERLQAFERHHDRR